MPTVLLLDVSLSMSRPVPAADDSEAYTRRQLAIRAINAFLDHLEQNCKLEFVSLMIFSALWENLVPFTRDYDEIRRALDDLQEYSKTSIEAALTAAKSHLIEEWGARTPCQVILITDDSTGVGPGSLKASLNSRGPDDPPFPLPFGFPCKIQILCITSPNDPALETAISLFQKLIDLNQGQGDLYIPESALSMSSVNAQMDKLAKKHYKPCHAVLKCGHLSSKVALHPSPEVYDEDHDFEHVTKTVSDILTICGFLDINDISSPPFISKHLVLPLDHKPENDLEEGSQKDDVPTFTVLLHGSLKVEGMVALVELSDSWFGMMYSWADSKKKSNLMLSIFKPGADVLPWLGNMEHLAPMEDFAVPPYGENGSKSPFPVRPVERRSYAQNCVVWIKPTGLQADLQKILRHARKLPEKQQHFYKELNRLQRAALGLGFHELLESTAQLLERECAQLPSSAHPDAPKQLKNAAAALRMAPKHGISVNIQPFRANFVGD